MARSCTKFPRLRPCLQRADEAFILPRASRYKSRFVAVVVVVVVGGGGGGGVGVLNQSRLKTFIPKRKQKRKEEGKNASQRGRRNWRDAC